MIVIQLLYRGNHGKAKAFAEEMLSSGLVASIRAEAGNLGYDYFFPMEDPDALLLVDRWESQASLDAHHASPMMGQIAALREKYDLHMVVEKLTPIATSADEAFIRR